jgi:hypothetical protein
MIEGGALGTSFIVLSWTSAFYPVGELNCESEVSAWLAGVGSPSGEAA